MRTLAEHLAAVRRQEDNTHDEQVAAVAQMAQDAGMDVVVMTPADYLAEWWRDTAEGEIDQTVAKAVEYGATDLEDLGHDLARAAGREVTDAQAAELGVYFYLRGKVSRWTAAVIEGRQVSDDTLLDIGIYVRMAQRIRAAGGWPAV